MNALAGFLLLGIVIGYARGGSILNLSHARLERPWLLAVALVLQLVANAPSGSWSWLALALVLTSFAAVGAFAFANRHAGGMSLIALGAFLNFLVIAVNGGMPVSAEAIAAAGEDPATIVLRGKHFVDHGDAHLRFLGDHITWPLRPGVISIGDLVLWTGIAWLLQDLMRARADRPQRLPWVEVS